jgi:Domain of unknown function (DUF6748)
MKTLSPLGAIAVLAVACASSDPSTTQEPSGGSSAPLTASSAVEQISTRVPFRYYTLSRDHRMCPAPACGGYWLREVNTSNVEYVSTLDLSALEDSPLALEQLRGAPDEELVLHGNVLHFSQDKPPRSVLGVIEAYRGMPGVVAAEAEAFFEVADVVFRSELAILLNRDEHRPFGSFDMDRVDHNVQTSWLVWRLRERRAIARGILREGDDGTGGDARVLDASQVYLRLPETRGPCPLALRPVPACEEGTVVVFTRNPDRCLVPAGCDKPGICPLFVLGCADGYRSFSWSSAPNACQVSVCDPAWVSE